MEQTTQMERILAELKTSLRELAGDRLIKTVLYGSRARGDYDEDSDTDVAVIIRGLSRDLKNRILDRVAGIELDHLRSLEGALRLLGLHFVRVGIIDKKSAQIFSKLMKFREEADYNPSMMFSEDDFHGYLHEAEEVASEIKDYILGENRGK